MTLPVWPVTLPQMLDVQGYFEEEPEYGILSSVESGVVHGRKRFNSGMRVFMGRMAITPSMKTDLTNFYSANCATPFLFPPEAGSSVIRTCKFSEKPTYETITQAYYYVHLKFEWMAFINGFPFGPPPSDANWPALLPQRLISDGFKDEEPDLLLITATESPYPKRRKKYTAAIRKYSGRMILHIPDQKNALSEFYFYYCNDVFQFPGLDGSYKDTRFLGKPRYEALSSIYYYVDLSLGSVP